MWKDVWSRHLSQIAVVLEVVCCWYTVVVALIRSTPSLQLVSKPMSEFHFVCLLRLNPNEFVNREHWCFLTS